MSAKKITGTQVRILTELDEHLAKFTGSPNVEWLRGLIKVQTTRRPKCEHHRAATLITNIRRHLEELEANS